ncbi:NEAT domain-containing protein, partial [Brochothrix thermosphacta]
MKTVINKFSVFVLIAMLVVSFFPSYVASADSTVLKDGGEYKVNVNFFKDKTGSTTKEKSVADDYINNEATIKVENNQPYLYLNVKNSSWWKAMAVSETGNRPETPNPKEDYAGKYNDVQIVSKDDSTQTQVIKIKVEDLNKIVYSYMHIVVDTIPGFTYDNWYQIDLVIDPASVQVISEPEEKPAALADGTYKVPFAAKHASEDKASSMQKYFDNPVYIQVKDGKRTAAMTINDTDTVKEFQTTVDGAFKETTTLSTKDKTRTVQFNVPDENADLLAHVNYEAPFNGGVHKGSADFRLAFDTTQATKVADSEFPVATPTEPEK